MEGRLSVGEPKSTIGRRVSCLCPGIDFSFHDASTC
jgi:hypothetical protein